MSISVETMIRYHLEALGADGLCNPDEECGCGLDDLVPCECLNLKECKAARWYATKPGDENFDEDFPEGYYKVIV